MKCVHCLNTSKKETRDHVFPKSWYTKNTPANVQRWTVPSCADCNEKFGKLEQELFIRLACCVNPQKTETDGIIEKLDKAFTKRPHYLKKIISELKPYNSSIKTFPGLGPHKDYSIESQRYINISPELINSVLGKIFRGIEYKMNNKYIENPLKLRIYHVHNEPKEITDIFSMGAKIEYLGPGFKIEMVKPNNTELPIIYKSTIWGTIVSYASIDNKNNHGN